MRSIQVAMCRSVFVLQACGLLHLMINNWRPMPVVLFDVSSTWLSPALHILTVVGFFMASTSNLVTKLCARFWLIAYWTQQFVSKHSQLQQYSLQKVSPAWYTIDFMMARKLMHFLLLTHRRRTHPFAWTILICLGSATPSWAHATRPRGSRTAACTRYCFASNWRMVHLSCSDL